MAFVYSCCFWFSLRLGGILIGVFSLCQGLLLLVLCCIAHTRLKDVQEEIGNLNTNMKLIYAKDYMENIRQDPDKFITFGICLSCFYIFLCLLYIYGAYKCSNMLMFGYILGELARLLGLAVLITTWLLILKQNTMDIGLLIGASVACGFFLLGMFYLWVCAANLPILINEMERDEQAATIARLRQILQDNIKPIGRSNNLIADMDPYRDVFVVERKRHDLNRHLMAGSGVNVPYYR